LYERIFELMRERGVKNSYIEKAIGAYRGKLSELKKGKTSVGATGISEYIDVYRAEAGVAVAHVGLRFEVIAQLPVGNADFAADISAIYLPSSLVVRLSSSVIWCA
jgi:hypothetical protein